jgi:hypothetical protein
LGFSGKRSIKQEMYEMSPTLSSSFAAPQFIAKRDQVHRPIGTQEIGDHSEDDLVPL